MVPRRAAASRGDAGTGFLGTGSAGKGLMHASCFHLPSLQGGGQVPSLPIPGTLLCSIHKTQGPGPRSLLRSQPTCKLGREPQEPTKSSSTPQGNHPGCWAVKRLLLWAAKVTGMAQALADKQGLLDTMDNVPHAAHLSATPQHLGGSRASPDHLLHCLGEEHLLLPSPSTQRLPGQFV